MNYEDYHNPVVNKAFNNSLSEDELLLALKEYVQDYEANQNIEFRMGMAYTFAGIMGSDLYRNNFVNMPTIARALDLCGLLEIDRQEDSSDWARLKALLSDANLEE